MVLLPIAALVFLVGFSIFYKLSLERSRARSRAVLNADHGDRRLTPAEQERLDAEAFNEMQRRSYSAAAANGQLPPLRQSAFQRVGTALFLGEMAYGSYELLGGHHGHHDDGRHGFDAVDLDNLS